jgi:hypothetical protein
VVRPVAVLTHQQLQRKMSSRSKPQEPVRSGSFLRVNGSSSRGHKRLRGATTQLTMDCGSSSSNNLTTASQQDQSQSCDVCFVQTAST